MVAGLAAFLLSSCSLVYTDQEDCDFGLHLRFKYDYNMSFGDAFASQVSRVSVYVFDEDGNIQIASDKNRRIVRILSFKDDGIHIENALKNKTLRIPWKKIAAINKSKEVKNGLEIKMRDGRYVSFSIYNSYKIQQITEFIANYIADKSNNRI